MSELPAIPNHRKHTQARLRAVLLAVLFLFAGAREAIAHTWCPHHDGPTAEQVTAGDHAHHAGDEHQAPGQSDEHKGGCTCLGTCQPGSFVPLLGSEPEYSLGSSAWISELANVPAPTALPGRIAYTLPYAQAPPAHS